MQIQSPYAVLQGGHEFPSYPRLSFDMMNIQMKW